MENENPIDKNEGGVLSDLDFEKLKCGNCGEYLNHPPIMAFRGRDNYAECGRCFNAEAAEREGLHPIRNRSLELLASITPFPCKHFKDGCTERRTWPQIEMHESECLHRTFRCPLSVLKMCTFRGGMQTLIEHFHKEHPDLLLTDGSLNAAYDKSFENHYLVLQNNNLFVFQVKYDVSVDKAWFVVNLLEEKNTTEFSLEFTSGSSQSSFITKRNAVFEPISIINVKEALEIDLKAVKTLLKEWENIKCKVFLMIRLPALHPFDLLKEVRCPVCWDYMKCRIFLCKNGHNVCSKCKEFALHCPTCRDTILDVRNLSLETLIAHAFFPCKNHNAGCNYVATLEETIYHFNHCSLTVPETE